MIAPAQELQLTEEALKSINFVLNLLEVKRDSLRKKRELLIASAKRAEGRGGS